MSDVLAGNIFLGLVCLDLLVEEARIDAWTHLQQRAHLEVLCSNYINTTCRVDVIAAQLYIVD